MSTIPYTMVFALLVLEMLIFGLLVIPLPRHWRSALLNFISKSPLVARGIHLLKILFVFVLLLFIDAVNRLQKHQTSAPESGNMYGHDPRLDASLAAKKFYTQRNMYLTGFTLFLSLILERTFKLVLETVQQYEEIARLKSQHTSSASQHDRRISDMVETHKEELGKLQKEIERKELDLATLQKQCQQQSDEYFRLADRNNELERRGLPEEKRKDK
ncbi:B-cell receptor-associated protein 31-like-domain-containing protein [Umbelopsis sp. PMI_123]|nr:B-cell receptor-associated protein 31-like-domain-containing protein [Umbelopsis sp. PMI_123]